MDLVTVWERELAALEREIDVRTLMLVCMLVGARTGPSGRIAYRATIPRPLAGVLEHMHRYAPPHRRKSLVFRRLDAPRRED